MKTIYGQDIYLDVDSQDYQMLSAYALKTYDVMQFLQMVYNNRGPATAIGVGLDGVLKINGLMRKSKSYSTASVVLSGTANTQINNGVIQDITGYKWGLPSSITIGSNSTATVLATCQTPGPVIASAGDINIIVTPTNGWASVTNPAAATLGANQEKDSAVRSRQAVSVALPTRSVLEGLKAEIDNTPAVTRSRVYENDTDEENSAGILAHSIAVVVDGGTDANIAKAIFRKKGPGTHTQGTTEIDVTDIFNEVNTIRFYRPTPVDVDVVVNVKSLSGYTTQTTADIKTKIANFLNSFRIGDSVSVSSLWGAALSAMSSLTSPTYSITSLTAAKHSGTQGSDDIVIAFNEAAHGNTSYITVNVT
jgi:Uncharacterized homolog of phage Mu protein gp47